MRDLDAIAAVAGESCDLLWSSFPCQAFSAAGKRLGAEDPRNGWPWSVDALDRLEPRWFLGENVRGLLCHRGDCDRRGDPMACPGCYLARVIMPQLRERFAFAGWWLLDAADFGVPQHRRRVILWAGPARLYPPKRTHGPGLFTRPWVSMGEALGLVGGDVASGICHTDPGTHGKPRPTTCPAPTVPVGSSLCTSGVPHFRVVEPNRTPPRDITDRPAPTIDGHAGSTGDKYEQAIRIMSAPSPTAPAAASGPNGQDSWMYVADQPQATRRRLTVEECAILQAFPDDHPWQGPKVARYRQVGNAVCPPMSEAVGRIVVAADHALN